MARALGGASAPNVGRGERQAQASLASLDSDLEAFSHYPADGSVAALPGRTAAKTNYLKPVFLSY